LYGQRLAVIATRRSADPDLVVRLPDGTAAAIARSLTLPGPLPTAAPAAAPSLLAPIGLRRLASLVAEFGRPCLETAAAATAVCTPENPRLP
jgi:hypothetical protein